MFRLTPKIYAWLDPATIEPQAHQQLRNIAELPFIVDHVAVMPDCHVGKGATIGTVIATDGAIVPAAVGVDIGCGMIAVRTRFASDDLPDSLDALRRDIERRIPLGAGGANVQHTASARARLRELDAHAPRDYSKVVAAWPKQLGTLGSGNHFIEICLDEADRVWAVLHSGSRGIGNRVADAHIKTAQRLMREAGVVLRDRDLAYLTEHTREFDDYMRDLHWLQEYARLNREEMMDRVLAAVAGALGGDPRIERERINCHHNFTQRERHHGREVWVTRKGAIQMRREQRGVIPGSMGSRSYVVSGLQNDAAFHSAPHGAGRRFSRTEARRRFTLDDFDAAMRGIACRRSSALLDELPGAYKDIDDVIAQSGDLVTVEHTLRQVLNVKGD